jgi:hypothetical protein
MTTAARNTQVTEAERIADQLERAFEGDAWNGPTVSEILTGITAKQAAARPLPAVHSIWEIVRHSTVWLRTVRQRLQGEDVCSVPDDVNWPEIDDPSPVTWVEAIEELRREYELLHEEALTWAEKDLESTPEGERYTAYGMLHGVIQHLYYHAGQIAILKKADLGVAK